MKKDEVIKKMVSNELTIDEFFKYVEESLIEEKGYTQKEVEYTVKLFRDPEFCKKETGYSFNQLCLMEDGFTSKQVRYVENNPCLIGPREECDYYMKNKKCFGCTNVNGFFFWKTEPEGKLKPVKETWNELSKKPVAFIFMNKEKE